MKHIVSKLGIILNISLCIIFLVVSYRGDNFRVAFAQLGELRSSLPHVPVIAETTNNTYESIVTRMLMENVIVVGMSPCQNNIFLSVVTLTLAEFADIVTVDIKAQGL
jgi:bloom syndrome protein